MAGRSVFGSRGPTTLSFHRLRAISNSLWPCPLMHSASNTLLSYLVRTKGIRRIA